MSGGRLERRAVVRALLAERCDLLVVSGLGAPSYDVAAAGDVPRNFYLWGAMGCAVSVGLGLALARPRERVLVITGDGELLMGIGALATVGTQAPANLGIVVLDNERFGETGGQLTHTALGADLAAIARAMGLSDAVTAEDEDSVRRLRGWLCAGERTRFAVVKIECDMPKMVLPPRDGAVLQNRFRAAVLGDALATRGEENR